MASQDMVKQVPVNSAVAIDEWTSIHEAESQGRGTNDGIEVPVRGLLEGDHAMDERLEIPRPCTDVDRQRLARLSVVPPDKAAFPAQAHRSEAPVFDHDLLETQEFLFVERVPARLANDTTPSLNPGLRRILALDGLARLGVIE